MLLMLQMDSVVAFLVVVALYTDTLQFRQVQILIIVRAQRVTCLYLILTLRTQVHLIVLLILKSILVVRLRQSICQIV